MHSGEVAGGPMLRLFQVKNEAGCAEELLGKFVTTSAAVVQNEPGNKGYAFGREIAAGEDFVVFASVWKDLEAIKQRFGAGWQASFLPPGYDDLIEKSSIRHLDMSSGWHVG